MGRRILLIQGHPDRDPHHLCRALAAAYAAGSRRAGHEVRHADVATLDVPLLRRPEEFEGGDVPDELKPMVDDLLWAEHVVLVFPLWLGMVPAALKALLEQVMRPSVAFEQGSGMPRGKLRGRSVRVVVTMGMPAFFYRLWFGAHGVKALERSVLRFVGMKPVRTTMLGMVGGASDKRRKAWLAKMERLGGQGR